MKHDFPGRWTNVVDKINAYLISDNSSYWLAGIVGFSALVKAFEYQKADKSPIHGAVKVLLPSVYNVMAHIVSNSTADSVALQKTIVKSYFKLIQVNINPLLKINFSMISYFYFLVLVIHSDSIVYYLYLIFLFTV